jgi:leucine dehydrogenase
MSREQILVQDYEKVYQYLDDDFHAFIALHSTKLGPALGGCRIRQYDSDADALTDALRLGKGMTLKNSAAGLNYGGGKCVVNAPSPNHDIMLHVGEIVEELGGIYITGEDVGTSVSDIKVAAEKTSHVLSLGAAGDPSPWTSLGVYEAIASARHQKYLPTTTLSIWVQGLGKVGWGLCEHLHKAGYKIYASDIIWDRVEAARNAFGAIPYTDWYSDDIDIYAPCALGGVINDGNVHTIRFPIICGSANNQLSNDSMADILHERNILYCPDFIVNAGGVIAAAAELTEYDEEQVRKDVMMRGEVLENCILLGEAKNQSPLYGAKRFAAIRLGEV